MLGKTCYLIINKWKINKLGIIFLDMFYALQRNEQTPCGKETVTDSKPLFFST